MIDKWGKRLFKTGGVWLVLLGLVHGISLFGKMTPANDTERQLLDLMTNYKFEGRKKGEGNAHSSQSVNPFASIALLASPSCGRR